MFVTLLSLDFDRKRRVYFRIATEFTTVGLKGPGDSTPTTASGEGL